MMSARGGPTAGGRLAITALAAACAGAAVQPAAAGLLDDRWVFRISGEETTVSELAVVWQGLAPSEQEQYLALDDPVRGFVLATARKEMVVLELARLGYLSSPDAVALERAWVRRYAGMRVQEAFALDQGSRLTEDDLDYFLDHFGDTVWITVDPGGPGERSDGPVHLPEMQRQVAEHVDTLAVGESLPGPGGLVFRLDSVLVPDSSRLAVVMRDSAGVIDYARRRLIAVGTYRRESHVTDSILAGGPPEFSTEEILECALALEAGGFPDPGDTLVTCRLGVLTARDLTAEMATLGGAVPYLRLDSVFVAGTLDGMVRALALQEYLGATDPAGFARVVSDAGRLVTMEMAELMYTDSIESRVSVEPGMIEAAYESLEQIPVVPERRRVATVLLEPGQVAQFRAARLDGRVDAMVDTLGFLPGLGDETSPGRISRPLERREMPFSGDSIFALSPADTLVWSEPHALPDGAWIAVRLAGVENGHEATLEEMSAGLAQTLRDAAAEEMMQEWMERLASRYSLVMNQDLLDDLPTDPSAW